jgi:hypothetical protein
MLVWLLIAIALLAVAMLLRHSTSSAHAIAVTTAISATRAMSM